MTHTRAEGGNGGLETGSEERGQREGGAAPPLVATATGPGEFPFRLTSSFSLFFVWGPRSSPPPFQHEVAAARPSSVLCVGCGGFRITYGGRGNPMLVGPERDKIPASHVCLCGLLSTVRL